jgi:hypothetical protein
VGRSLDIVLGIKHGLSHVSGETFTMIELEHVLSPSGKSEGQVFADLRGLGNEGTPEPACTL